MNWREDKSIIVLSGFTLFFAAVSLSIAWLRPSDGQTYQTFVSMLSGFGGALLLKLNPRQEPPAGSTTTTSTAQTTTIPPEGKDNP